MRYFVAVAAEEHFGRAAVRLGISTPPLSRQIQELEREIGTPLFERIGRRVRLTDAGRVFLDRAHAILMEVDRSAELAQATTRGEFGRLAIRFFESTSYLELVPKVIERFRTLHPRIQLYIEPVSTIDDLNDLKSGHFHAAYCYRVPAGKGFKSDMLFVEQLLLALPANHPLARKHRVPVDALKAYSFIGITQSWQSPSLRKSLDELNRKVGHLDVIMEVSCSTTRLQLVASGMGLTFVGESAAPILPANVVLRPLADFSVKTESYLAWAERDDSSPVVCALRSISHELSRFLPVWSSGTAAKSAHRA